MPTKRSYTVPILLVIATILLFVIVVLFSKLLLTEQSAKTDKGIRLASSYNYCLLLANTLNNDVGDMAETDNAAARLPLKGKVGKLALATGECGTGVMVKAQTLNGSTDKQAMEALNGALQPLSAKLDTLGDHEGPLTADELKTVKLVHDAGVQLEQTLKEYSLPTSDDRYRQMAAGAEWPDVALRAFKQLQDLAAALK